jgi:hypothetical protein
MYNKEIAEAAHRFNWMIRKAIEEELLSTSVNRVDLEDCKFLSYSIDDMIVETSVTAVYIKENTVWADFEDEYTGKHSEPLAACFTIDELLTILNAM